MTWDFLTLLHIVLKHCNNFFETFRNNLQQRHSVNLVKLSKYFGLFNLYVSMFQCFTETNGWPGISVGFLCNICQMM